MPTATIPTIPIDIVRILTIEDDQTTANEIATELRAHGYTVDVVSDGQMGLERAREGHMMRLHWIACCRGWMD
jgi:CheY-like chemotaxis protein